MDTNESLKVTYLSTNRSTCKIDNVTCVSSVDTKFWRIFYINGTLHKTLLRGTFTDEDSPYMDVFKESDLEWPYLGTETLVNYDEQRKCGIVYTEFFEDDYAEGMLISCELRFKTNGLKRKTEDWPVCEDMFNNYCPEPKNRCFPELWPNP